jgi:hypothetical protein
MPTVWNGTRDDAAPVKPRWDDPSVQRSPAHVTEDRMTSILRKAQTEFWDKPDHHARCINIHCRMHHHLFPASREYCLTRDVYVSSLWPLLFMCRQCADLLKMIGEDHQIGTITMKSL